MTLGAALRLPTPAPDLDEPRPALHSLTEQELVLGYRRDLVRWEACACGGILLQLEGDEVDGVDGVVATHNRTFRHDAWSAQTRLV